MMESTGIPLAKEVNKRVLSKISNFSSGNIDHPLPNEHWNPLLFACSLGDLSCVKFILEEKDADTDRVPEGRISPKMTSVHMCALYNNTDLINCVVSPSNINIQDQWGFSALHYAAVHRCSEVVHLLLRHGADASLKSMSGNTALDLCQALNFSDIADTLASSMHMKEDPSAPNFRKWLRSVGAGAYISSFFKAGYDLGFIAKHGLTEKDLDCIGIPAGQLGVRRKLETLHNISNFHVEEEEEEDEEDDSDSDSEPDDDDSDAS
mmetsp:Transcript_24018/g.44595  ORF Transcript_24018/g.44595 Transcript_24018/m.44595 type:complete len:264 (+) Transcript_24018:136-927(+)